MALEEPNQGAGRTTPSYGGKEWIEDWTWISQFQENIQQAKASRSLEPVVAYFDDKYHSRADYHRERMLAALRYVDRHISGLNEGTIAIAGEKVAAVGRPLVLALWRLYSNMPDAHLKTDFPVSEVLALARDAEKRMRP